MRHRFSDRFSYGVEGCISNAVTLLFVEQGEIEIAGTCTAPNSLSPNLMLLTLHCATKLPVWQIAPLHVDVALFPVVLCVTLQNTGGDIFHTDHESSTLQDLGPNFQPEIFTLAVLSA